MKNGRLNRRQMLAAMSTCAAGGASGLAATLGARRASAQAAGEPKFLIVLAAAGGASIIDSFLAIREAESANAQTINTFPDREVESFEGTALRAVSFTRSETGPIPIPFTTDQASFVRKHRQDLLVATQTGTSVNHNVGQRRSITGNEAWRGRTIQECVALAYGASFPLPNVNMAAGGFIEHGTDRELPAWAFNEPVANPTVWPVSLDAKKGQLDLPSPALIEAARGLRDTKLDPESGFFKTFQDSDRLARWAGQRQDAPVKLEGSDLVSKLLFLPESNQVPLSRYGLTESPDAAKVREKFPDFLTDPLDAQAALAFLLIKHRVSVTVTISPSFAVLLQTTRFPPKVVNPPLAYDFSHNAHRAAQGIMWSRILRIADGLIDLLKGEESSPGSGRSLWDDSMIYMATEFGRDKRRPAGAADFGTAHNLNNGVAILSPMVKGNTVLGGVDPDTGLTYGYDPVTGAADPSRTMAERFAFAGILQSLGVDTSGSGLPSVPAMRR